MRQLVGQEHPSPRLVRRELPLAEHDVAPHRIRERIQATGGLRGRQIRMGAHLAEVVSEPRLQLRPQTLRKGLTTGA